MIWELTDLNDHGLEQAMSRGLIPRENADSISLALGRECFGNQFCLGNGAPVAIGGVIMLAAKRGRAWFITGKAGRERPIPLFRWAKRVIEGVARGRGLRRIDCEIKASNKTHIHFSVRLGFEIEGKMKNYGPDGSDYLLMARTWQPQQHLQ